MKAAISYICSCGAEYLLCVHRNETTEEAAAWRERVEDVGDGLGVGVVDGQQDVFRCPRCGAVRGDVADVAVAAD
jgi:hypothetical protein